MRGALPNSTHSGLHLKPLDAAIGQVPRRIALVAAKVIDFGCKHKNTIKTQLLAS
jgi:hypothetical protein